MSTGWDNATLKKLKALTCKGLSTSEIGKRLGMSKNAIVGKLNRLGWNAKAGGAAAADVQAVIAKKTSTAKATVAKKTTAKTSKSTAGTVAKAGAVKKATVKKATATKSVAGSKKATAVTPKATEKKSAGAKSASAKSVKVAKGADVSTGGKNTAVHQRIIQHSLEMANLKPNQCRWPIGDPDSEHFHFCGETVFVGKPYCYEHCKQAYQFTMPKKK